ncbi:MAG: sulfoxide reductase heme-binding subunit YedZ [Cellvibrionaceae bacterium]
MSANQYLLKSFYKTHKVKVISAAKLLISVACVLHIGYFVRALFCCSSWANPVEKLSHATGEWGLHFLLLSLLISPLRRHLMWSDLLKFRRFLGLWSFVYIFVHFFGFILFDHFFYLPSIVEDVIDRPYIAVGFVGFVLIIPLAITSFKRLQKKLGKHWFTLHKLVYLIGILGVVHYWWLVKADVFWPMIYAAIVFILLADRLFVFIKKRQDKKQPFKNATTGSGNQ